LPPWAWSAPARPPGRFSTAAIIRRLREAMQPGRRQSGLAPGHFRQSRIRQGGLWVSFRDATVLAGGRRSSPL
jgi:hypothetical protein